MPELSVSKKTVGDLLNDKKSKFVIPDYQRPYSWDEEKCDVLWNDIVDFSEAKQKEPYFLGSIVVCKEKDGATHIIDGQQRIISLTLLLRAFYKHLESMKVNPEGKVTNLMNRIRPCIWFIDPTTGKIRNSDKKEIRIQSNVATAEDNDIFHQIISAGKSPNDDKKGAKQSRYSHNFNKFYEWCVVYSKKETLHWYQLCIDILDECVLLPIECESVDSALDIFNTLNDRGLPLSDADVFKARIYKSKQSPKDKDDFTENWRTLTENVETASIKVTDLFRYYSHYLRGKAGDKSKEIALRNFYAKGKKERYERLNSKNSKKLIEDLIVLSEFWGKVHKREYITQQKTAEEIQYLHCLQMYPNDYWRYLVSVFYLVRKDTDNFGEDFVTFLKKLTAFLYAKFVISPTVNAIKDDVFRECADLCKKKSSYKLRYKMLDGRTKAEYQNSISSMRGGRLHRGLILLHAYQHPEQTDAIESKFQIEHIFPKKWQNTNYNGWSHEDAKQYLEWFGNKVAIGKKLNIEASNIYFGKKKKKYANSKVAAVRELANYPKDDWKQKDIEKRERDFKETIYAFFDSTMKGTATTDS